jgi:hypothetical protein
MRMRSLVFLTALLLAPSAQAMTVMEQDFVCPIGGETFKQQMAGSGTQFGMFLDTKPYGPIAAPWPLAVCPKNGFVIYKNDYDDNEKKALTAYVASEEYRAMVRQDTAYYRAAMLMRRVDPNNRDLPLLLLSATWETETDPVRYARYAEAALEAFRALTAKEDAAKLESKEARQTRLHRRLLIGELLRRLSRFDEASAHFATLETDIADQPAFLKGIVRYQRELIAARDAAPHRVPEEKPTPSH